MPMIYKSNRNGGMDGGTNGVSSTLSPGGVGGGIRSPPPLTTVSPITTPSPRLELPKNKKAINSQRTIDEMRAHIAKLKNELDQEKSKNKQLYRDKVSEIRQAKDACGQDKEYALEQMEVKLEQEKSQELNRQREQLLKEKEKELRQILKQKEEEVRRSRAQFSREKDDDIKAALEMQKKVLTEQRDLCSPGGASGVGGGTGGGTTVVSPGTPGGTNNSALIVRLQREIKQLKDSKKDTEEQLKVRSAADAEKHAELRRIRRDHQAEIARLVREHKQETQRDMLLLRRLEDSAASSSANTTGRSSAASILSQDERLGSAGSSRREWTESSGSTCTTPISRQGSVSAAGTDAEDEVSHTFLSGDDCELF